MSKGIIQRFIADSFLLHFISQPVMPVHIKLETKRRPGRNTKIAQSEFFVDEIEIVVQTFAGVIFQKCFSACFVMPWFISVAAFHR